MKHINKEDYIDMLIYNKISNILKNNGQSILLNKEKYLKYLKMFTEYDNKYKFYLYKFIFDIKDLSL